MKNIRTYHTRLLTSVRSLTVGTRSSFWRGMAVITLLAFCNWTAQSAAPPAGTPIGNQASATYTDGSNASRTATSNPVTTIVQQVYGLTLEQDRSVLSAPGSSVSFPHVLKNTGNGSDTFNFLTANVGGTNINFLNITIYADDGSGNPTGPAITASPSLAAGASFQFVVVATVPGAATAGQTAKLNITATSVGDGSQTTFNADTARVTGNAVISLNKGINVNSGASPSGPYTYTITFQNNGNSAATNIVIVDQIPTGMSYVSNSARASITGNTVLTDSDDTDWQGTAPNAVTYDYGVSAAGKITAKFLNLDPGQSVNVTFQINVNSGVAPTQIANTATFSYWDGAANQGPFVSNPALFNVLQTAGVTLGDDTIATANQGSTITFTNDLVNTGNGPDSFDLTVDSSTFPLGTTITFYNSGGSPMQDSGGSPAPDTGIIAAGAHYPVLVVVTLPPSATAAPYQLVKRATSTFNPAVSDPGTDTLSAISVNAVDIANNSANGPGYDNAGASTGNGSPEVAAVTTLTTDPGTTKRFTLYINNRGPVGDTYDLSASTDSTFAAITLPAGWTAVFKDSTGTPVANTGIILSGTNKLIYADITVPANQAPVTAQIYFRAKSPTSMASDRKHDALTINAVRSIQLSPNNSGQVFPGGSVVYSHVIQNLGNVTEGDGAASTINFTIANTGPSFTSVIYLDSNNNGVLDTNDVTIANLTAIGGLAPGAATNIFVKVFAPAGATPGSVDVATLTATTVNGTNPGTAPAAVHSVDTTTVISGDLTIVKEQALDANGNGVLDGAEAYSTADITTGARPGASILYRLRVTNTGTANATSVVVTDTTPTFTKYSDYSGAHPAASTQGTVTAPASGSAGTISVAVGTMTPGQVVTITFGVTIDQ